MQAARLNEEFGIPNTLRFEESASGLTRAVILSPMATAEIYLQGAHLTAWSPLGQKPVLYLSPNSSFMPGKAIRGGVPIIFPWFGPRHDGRPGPAHGFARTALWTLEAGRLRADSKLEIALALHPDESERHGGPEVHLRFRLTIGLELEMQFEVRNDSFEAFSYEDALHTYFAVDDIRHVVVSGLEGTSYIDKTDQARHKQHGNEPMHFIKETDQVHLHTRAACVIHDPVWNRRIVIEKSGSDSTVVWNPWIEKSTAMSDMPVDGWKQMLCVETANVAANAICLAPGESHTLTTTLRVE